MKIQFNLKTYSPSRACEVTHTFTVWAREGAGGGFRKSSPPEDKAGGFRKPSPGGEDRGGHPKSCPRRVFKELSPRGKENPFPPRGGDTL